jgi:hypothetical protein
MAKRDGDRHLPKQQTVLLPATMRPTRATVKAKRQREATLFIRNKSSVAAKRVRDRNRGRDTKQQLLQQAATIEEQKDLIEKQHLALVLAEEQLMKMQNSRDLNRNTLQTSTPSDQLLVVHQLEERVFGADRLSYRSIGMSEFLFNDLLDLCLPYFQSTNQRGENRVEPEAHSSMYTDKDQLFLTLYWLRFYPTMIELEVISGIHERTLTRIVNRALAVLTDALKSQIKWPNDQEIVSMVSREPDPLVPNLNSAVFMIDGTRVDISRPDKLHQSNFYSGKSKTHNKNILFVIDKHGRCVYVSKSFPGNANDQKMWNESKLRPLLEGKQYGIIGDMGFTFNRLVDSVSIQGFSPKKKQKGQLHHDAITKEKNAHISSIRVQIEHYFARLKAWRVLKGVFRHFSALGHNILDFDVIVHCIASLIDWLRSKPSYDPSHEDKE